MIVLNSAGMVLVLFLGFAAVAVFLCVVGGKAGQSDGRCNEERDWWQDD